MVKVFSTALTRKSFQSCLYHVYPLCNLSVKHRVSS